MPSAQYVMGNAMEIFALKLSSGNLYAISFLIVIILIIIVAISILRDGLGKNK